MAPEIGGGVLFEEENCQQDVDTSTPAEILRWA